MRFYLIALVLVSVSVCRACVVTAQPKSVGGRPSEGRRMAVKDHSREDIALPETSLPLRFRSSRLRYRSQSKPVRFDAVDSDTCLYADGRVARTYRHYSALARPFTKAAGVSMIFDSSSRRLLAIGPVQTWGKQGRWFSFDSSGKRHKAARFKYALRSDTMRAPNGRRRIAFYYYGFAAGQGVPSAAEDRFAFFYTAIGGCVFSNEMEIRRVGHNSINELIQVVRWGRGWKRRFEDLYWGN